MQHQSDPSPLSPPTRFALKGVCTALSSTTALLTALVGPALADDPVRVVRTGSTGTSGKSGSPTGDTGGTALGSYTYSFGPEITSNAENTAAFYLILTGGVGGKGHAACCGNGGNGGAGGNAIGSETILLNGVANLTTTQSSSAGIEASITGGNGGRGGNGGAGTYAGGAGGAGGGGLNDGTPRNLFVTSSTVNGVVTPWVIGTAGNLSPALTIIHRGGNGGGAGTGTTIGNPGGPGGGGQHFTRLSGDTSGSGFAINAKTTGDKSPGISVLASPNDGNPFGAGGTGGANNIGLGGRGGPGATPGETAIELGPATISTSGDSAPSVLLLSQGGQGGQGGKGEAGQGGTGGAGGGGGRVSFYQLGKIDLTTKGTESDGIGAYSLGGAGGLSGDGSFAAAPGKPGPGSASGPVTVEIDTQTSRIQTNGYGSFGIIAQSIGGHGGAAGNRYGVVSFAANGGSAGDGGSVSITHGDTAGAGVQDAFTIETTGQGSPAIAGYSLGGGGGHGGDAFGAFFSSGGSGGAGGSGKDVTITNFGVLEAANYASDGILAQSVGGAGGSGGWSGGLLSLGGRSKVGANGGNVLVQNAGTVKTGYAPSAASDANDDVCSGCSYGILAQSIGGGGGKGGFAGGWINVGGTAGAGGAGGDVVAVSAGDITTNLNESAAIMAQSIGGGGGTGGGAGGGGVGLSISVGGTGGSGGAGGDVTVSSGALDPGDDPVAVLTKGINSPGLVGQSIGGGGGNGGGAVSVGAISSVSVGGSGASGGDAGHVNVSSGVDGGLSGTGTIETQGARSEGILAQSVGGGGGRGGFAADGAFAAGVPSIAVGIGGSGGKGGDGGPVSATTGGAVTTAGFHSAGVIAQSLGGGGGSGGFSVAISGSTDGAIAVGVGGSGTSGGSATTTMIDNRASVTTRGQNATGLFAQSIGGGGGNGGMSISGTASLELSAGVSVGGSAAGGGHSGSAIISNTGTISTSGDDSPGVAAQSIGGGGGHGGLSVEGQYTANAEAQLGAAIGGTGGAGGDSLVTETSFAASVNSTAAVQTEGDRSTGIMAQSIGGGGGSGGSAVGVGITSGDGVSLGLSLGGRGEGGGSAADVNVNITGAIRTAGMHAGGVLAQSLGGGGGNGGTAFSGSMTTGKGASLDLSIGGGGGAGGSGGTIEDAMISGDVTTTGPQSDGIVLQSIGGGGGNGGWAISGDIATSGSTNLNVALGGKASGGGSGGRIQFETSSAIIASGAASRGIVVQSIGGGGGNGGMAITGSFTSDKDNKELGLALGGGAGSGSPGASVEVESVGPVTTGGTNADTTRSDEHAILVQSIGGGGGSGGMSANARATTTSKGTKSISIGIGGGGGSGAKSSTVEVLHGGTINTINATSHGILAQSIAGGGGAGGATATYNLQSTSNDSTNKSAAVSVGGSGGGGASAGNVSVDQSGTITATGIGSRGVVAQSISGGGGVGGSNLYRNQKGKNSTNTLTFGIGGKGGGGSNAGSVSLTTIASGSITTGDTRLSAPDGMPAQRYAGHGILLQSIGGGGGDGGTGIQGNVAPSGNKTSADIGIGGTGKAGGDGGNVTVGTPSMSSGGGLEPAVGTIRTTDTGSHALFAQSIGGGGGTGGTGISGDVKNSSGKNLTIGIGNFGGGGGNGANVTVQSAFDITTLGAGSKAILVQSIGGGGGSGGTELSGSVSSSNDDGTKQITAGIGLNGGGGGNGGNVLIGSNANSAGTNAIVTGQNAVGGPPQVAGGVLGADGIMAQSIGGGGGSGGVGIKNGTITTDTKKQAASLDLGIGTNGGAGGTGGAVTVVNTLNIDTYGPSSRGIFAQSIGGGGGDGGLGISNDITSASNSTAGKQLSLGVGGGGGTAGNAGQVLVLTGGGGTITTHPGSSTAAQGQMHGILAQSIGGGGGNGAVGMSGNITGSKETKAFTLAVGGNGANGGDGDQSSITGNDVRTAGVGVQSAQSIQTSGDNSVGIFAQNIGGGGGNGAVGLSGKVDAGGGKAVTFALGGTGGGGGKGGSVYVNNLSSITTGAAATTADPTTNQSHGILAQSIGGGGGTGSHTGSLLYGSTSSGTEKGIAFQVGATASGGTGGEVFVNTPAGIETFDDGSHGVVAQSIGGGGGLGGSLGGIGTEDASNTWQAAVAIGGGGGAGNSGAVTIEAGASRYQTHGNGAFGLFAQSIGGGGGAAGNAAGLDETGNPQQTTKNANFAVNIGGANGSSGTGSAAIINLPGDGAIITTGIASIGAIAQSIGGGGGTGGVGAQGVTGKITVGGSENASGNGDTAQVTNRGFISTGGSGTKAVAAHGIVAQSIGGGGGYGGSVDLADADFGSNLDGMSLSTVNSGDGGTALVEIEGGGSVYTTGGQSAGIIAQSVSGGGGISGATGTGSTTTLFGSGGGSGTAGAAIVNLTTDHPFAVNTKGDGAHGVIAQSAGGAGSATTTRTMAQVHVSGNVSATGSGSAAIIAQSVGNGRGQVNVTVDEGFTVTGGTDRGVGVEVRDGVDSNLLTNNGTITTSDGASGIAADYWGSAKLNIDNTGTLIGSILTNGNALAGTIRSTPGPITLDNGATGTVIAGDLLDVSRFSNKGMLHIGSVASVEDQDIGTSVITGSYRQSGSGKLAVDLDLGRRAADLLDVRKEASLAGRIEVTSVNIRDNMFSAAQPSSVDIIRAGNGISLDGLAVKPSAAGRYALEQHSDDTLRLAWNVDFANDDILEQTNKNQDQLVGHIHELFVAGTLSEYAAEEANTLLAIETAADFATAANSLSAEAYLNTQLATLNNAFTFGQDMMDCTARDGSYRFVRQTQCAWLDLGASRFSQNSNSQSTGFDVDTYRIAGGAQFEIEPDLHVGFALAYLNSSLDMHDANGTGNTFQIGAMVERGFGPATLAASVSTGYGTYDVTRTLATGGTSQGDQSIRNVSAMLRGAYTFDQGNWQITPRLDLGLDHIDSDTVSETGSSPFDLMVSGGSNTFYWLRPSVEFAGEFELGNGNQLRPEFTLGLTHYLGGDTFSAQSQFEMTPSNLDGFANEVNLGRTYVDVTAGLKLLKKSNVTLDARIFGRMSGDTNNYGGMLQIEYVF